MTDTDRQLLDFIENSPTAFHAVDNIASRLVSQGYTKLYEGDKWHIDAPGKYFVERNGSAVIAFNIPKSDFIGFMITASHCDSPCFRIKDNWEAEAAGAYARLSVEKYGGMLCSSWLDRPLSVAGRVAIKDVDKIQLRLVNVDRDLLLIPNVAIHMDRSANDGRAFNVNVDMLPLLSSTGKNSFESIIAQTAGVDEQDILSRELYLYARSAGTVWGAENEFISSPRLDDLQCVFGCMEGFFKGENSDSVNVLCVLDNEEVGSGTKQGADSDFMESCLYRICYALGKNRDDYLAALSNSFMVSADNAHAVHPNHPEYADRNDKPTMNGGVVIKFNASQKYTSDGVSSAVFKAICERAGVPVQTYTNRADLPGGSTLGNISLSHVSVDAVDIGLAQLAMHSAYETAGAKDTDYLISAAKEFYSSSFRRHGSEISF